MHRATLDGTWIRLSKELVDAAGLHDGDELQVEVEGPGELRVSAAPASAQSGANESGAQAEPGRDDRMAALLAGNPGLLVPPVVREGAAPFPVVTDEDRQRVARSLSRGKSLVDDIVEERRQGY